MTAELETTKQIVKIQVSVFNSVGVPQQVLVYNQHRTVWLEAPIEPRVYDSIQGLFGYMAGRLKAYFYAHRDSMGCVVIDHDAPDQDW